ncbi:MAG: nucleotidyltransferase domain-containing protein [Nanoarchaeota archaeon]
MASPSKENNVIKLILENSPLKEWHFAEVVKEAKVTKAVANKWLKKCVEEGILMHVKKKGQFPHFTAGTNNPYYQSMKRMFALEQLHASGLIPRLLETPSAKTVIVFGSFAKGDWYKDSDIDVFVLGHMTGFDKHSFERKLNKKIELHVFENRKELGEVKSGLLKNVINGYVVKGQIQDVAEVA